MDVLGAIRIAFIETDNHITCCYVIVKSSVRKVKNKITAGQSLPINYVLVYKR